MAAIAIQNKDKLKQAGFYDFIEPNFVYTGFSQLPYQMYATKDYQKKKIKPLLIGGINRIVYSAFEHDPTPIILTLAYEPQYNTVLSLNLRYLKPTQKRMLLDYILKSNKLRIKQQKPLVIPEWKALKRKFPFVQLVVRRYKVISIGVIETPPLLAWPKIAEESSPYSYVGSQKIKSNG